MLFIFNNYYDKFKKAPKTATKKANNKKPNKPNKQINPPP